LKDDKGQILREYYLGFSNSQYYNSNDFTLTDKITNQPISGNWHFSYNAPGAMPATDLYITVPDMWFYFTSSGRSRDGMISQEITLKFTR
jgi:glucan-binding YG repeat protein